MYIDGVTLYYSPECPYCRQVLAFMSEHDIQLNEKNVLYPGIGEELEEVSGRRGIDYLTASSIFRMQRLRCRMELVL